MSYHLSHIVAVVLLAGMIGCTSRPTLMTPRDPNLRKTSTQFAADAAVRHPYKAEAPRAGEAVARAEVGYMLNHIDVVNLTEEQWENVELWINQRYVVHLPVIEPRTLKKVSFRMLFDDQGNHFPTQNMNIHVNTIEAYMNGRLYDIPVRLAD